MTTKQYLQFSRGSIFGIIASASGKILQVNQRNNKDDFVAVPACENILLWNLQTKEKHMVLNGETSAVTSLVTDHNHRNIAVGYADGMIRIFDLQLNNCTVSFIGHKSAVSCLAYDSEGSNLASGGKDSEIVIWNVTDQAGLYRLKGHKGPISKVHFFQQENILISSSKDTYIKLWDLDTQHCFQTIVGTRHEILDFVIIKGTRLVTGINGEHLNVWDLLLSKKESSNLNRSKRIRLEVPSDEDESEADNLHKDESEAKNEGATYVEVGKLATLGNKTTFLFVDKTERLLGCHASTKVLQLFKILNSKEKAKKFRKRQKKELKERRETDEEMLLNSLEIEPALVDEFQALEPIQMSGKIDSFFINVDENDIAKIMVLLKNNSICQYKLDLKVRDLSAVLCHNITLPGHRNFVRSLNYSADNSMILSASEEAVKIWKSYKDEETCTHTLKCDSALCSVFVTGNSHCIIGTKNGRLEIFDINAREMLESVQAHEGSVKCITISPDQCGVTSGGSDKDVKFWDFELIKDEQYSVSKKRLSLKLKRTLKMPEEILCLKYSPDKNKLAVALLDFTVQVLFSDTLKLAFSLYGHALPVTCMDISYDSSLIVTGSEDKDVRIWSMEFGSCNKFLKRAHDKGITCLSFLPKTHYFFTGGRDSVIKQWDADNFQKITALKGHQNEVSCMTVSPDGSTLVTASKDRSIRIWEKTNEILVLEEEQEKEREEDKEAEDLPVIPGEVNKEVGLPGLKTMETIKSVDQLIEAIDIYKEEIMKLREHELECKKIGKELPPPTPHPLLTAFNTSSPIKYINKVINRIKSSELEGTLLYLPFNYVLDFLRILSEFVDRGWETELCERCASFLVRIHFGQILSSRNFHPVIEKLKDKLFSQVYHTRDMIGFVRIATHLQQRAIEAQEEVPVFTSILDGLQKKRKRSKRQLERHIVSFT